MSAASSLREQFSAVVAVAVQAHLSLDEIINQIENGLPVEVPMKTNELPGPYITRPYIVNIGSLARGNEYDLISNNAKRITEFLSKPDNRTLGQKKFRLVNFGCSIASCEVIEWGKQAGLVLPEMAYVNDFAKANP